MPILIRTGSIVLPEINFQTSRASFFGPEGGLLGAEAPPALGVLATALADPPSASSGIPNLRYKFWSWLAGKSGLKRNAALGTLMTLVAVATGMLTYAVIPGNSFNSGLSKSMTVSYVTTFWTTVEFILTCETVPAKVSRGYASTLKVTSDRVSSRPRRTRRSSRRPASLLGPA